MAPAAFGELVGSAMRNPHTHLRGLLKSRDRLIWGGVSDSMWGKLLELDGAKRVEQRDMLRGVCSSRAGQDDPYDYPELERYTVEVYDLERPGQFAVGEMLRGRPVFIDTEGRYGWSGGRGSTTLLSIACPALTRCILLRMSPAREDIVGGWLRELAVEREIFTFDKESYLERHNEAYAYLQPSGKPSLVGELDGARTPAHRVGAIEALRDECLGRLGQADPYDYPELGRYVVTVFDMERPGQFAEARDAVRAMLRLRGRPIFLDTEGRYGWSVGRSSTALVSIACPALTHCILLRVDRLSPAREDIVGGWLRELAMEREIFTFDKEDFLTRHHVEHADLQPSRKPSLQEAVRGLANSSRGNKCRTGRDGAQHNADVVVLETLWRSRQRDWVQRCNPEDADR